MTYDVILISGTPASGKDTLSDKLLDLKDEIVSFTKHKGSNSDNKKGNYHYLSILDFKKEVDQGNFIQYHQRYGNYYGIHKEEVERLMSEGKIPIIHVGKYENLRVIMRDKRISNPLSILFYVRKEETEKRLNVRHIGDNTEISQRLEAFDEEISQLQMAFKNDKELLFHKIFENEYDDIEEAGKSLLVCIENTSPQDLVTRGEIEEILCNE